MPKRPLRLTAELFVPWNFIFVSLKILGRACGPDVGQGHGFAGALVAGRVLDALVEDHDDVRAERNLHSDGVLGGEEVLCAVEVRAELDAVGRDLSELGQGENLEAAGVS